MDSNAPDTHAQRLDILLRGIPELAACKSGQDLLIQTARTAALALECACALFLPGGGRRMQLAAEGTRDSRDSADAADWLDMDTGLCAEALRLRSPVIAQDPEPLVLAPVFHGDAPAAILRMAGANLNQECLPLIDHLAGIAGAMMPLVSGSERAAPKENGNFVHDLNNLLAIIIGNAQIALSGLGDHENSEEVQEILEAARRARALSDSLRTARGGAPEHERQEPLHPPGPAAASDCGGTVLIVDDEPALLRMAEKMLAREGYSVVCAPDGAGALEIFREQRAQIHAVVLDMIMPGMDGAEVFHALKAEDPGVSVILASGFSREGRVSELLASGARGFVQKPFSAAELCRILDETLKSRP
jgi:CheY-like chemotaxis protein